jgi:hypothetical protein
LRAIFEVGLRFFWGLTTLQIPKKPQNALQNFGFFWYFFFHKKKYKEQAQGLCGLEKISTKVIFKIIFLNPPQIMRMSQINTKYSHGIYRF